MEKTNLYLFCGLYMSLFFGVLTSSSAQCLPSLGTASGFTIFTNAGAVSNVTSSTITGNIGSNVGAISGFETSIINGQFFNANSVTQNASIDLAAAYIAYQNLTPNFTTHTPAYGSGETLIPGIYYIGAAGSIAGTLTLDAQNNPNDKFILKFVGAFTAGAGSTVVLTNGALPNNVYWIVGGAFSLAAQTNFTGTIIADGAISVGVGAQLNCKLLSISGAISTYGTLLTNEGIDNSSNLFYADADLDGYGNPNSSSCYALAGYVLNNTDCNDTDAAIHPNAVEIYGNAIDDDCNGIADTDAESCSFTTTWNGTSWSPFLPIANQRAVIAGNYSQSSDLFSCTLEVINDAVVNVPSGTNFFINGVLSVAPTATVLFNNNTNLIQTDQNAVNSGNITVKRNTSPIIRLDHTLWSSPVIGQNLFNFSPETLTHRFYTYDAASNAFSSTSLNSFSEFTPAKGFTIRAPNNQSSTIATEWTGTFMGVPNNGTFSFPLASYVMNGSNYNLVGNPFPSAINANKFLQENENTIEGVIYYYQHTLTMNAAGIFPIGTNFASWTATGGTPATSSPMGHPAYGLHTGHINHIIQVGQGFFVKAIASGNVTFTNSMRVANQGNQFHKSVTTAEEKDRIWLNLTSDIGDDINQILVGYVAEATQDVDSKFDGLSYGNSGSFIYSVIDGDSYVIQGRALPFETTDEVPLGFKCTAAGTYSIKLTDMDGLFLDNQDVFIRDNLTGTDTNIKIAPYTFTSDVGTFDNRFKIVYTQALGVPSNTFTQNSIIVYKNSNEFHISTKGILIRDILVYDILGRVIYKLNDTNNTNAVLRGIETTNQVVLLKIISEDNQSVTVKVIN
jgi:hypothetical protein